MPGNQPEHAGVQRWRLTRKIGLHHIAFFRGCLEGLDLSTLGERYLETGADRRKAKATQRWIRDELIAAARRRRPYVARLLGIAPSRYAADGIDVAPSLEDFRASRDPDGFYCEAELIELFTQEYGSGDPAAVRKSRRNEKLRRKLVEAIRWLESVVVSEPVADDPLNVWLDDSMARRLQDAGLLSIDDLVDLIVGNGKNWHRRVPRLGPIGAGRIERWLRANRLLSMAEISQPTAIAAAAPRVTGIVPIERLYLPPNLSGRDGNNRVRAGKLNAQDDHEAIQVWLDCLGPRFSTVRSYRTQAERFLLWMILERRKAMSSATTEDCIGYRDWLNALGRPEQPWRWQIPGSRWIGPRAAPRFSANWRPFSGCLAPSSQKLAVTVLTAMCEWLVRQKYLEFNPWDGVPPSYNLDGRIRTDHSLTHGQWREILVACDSLPPGESRLRMRFTLLAAYGLGLRLSELVSMRVAKREEKLGELNLGLKPGSDGDGWDLDVLGKRNKRRVIPVPASFINALGEYLDARGFGNSPGNWPEGLPLIATLATTTSDRSGISQSGLYRMLRSHFKRTAMHMRSPADAGHLLSASTHWLRHTHATHSLSAGVPIDAVQENMGHSSVAVTAVYTHAGRKRRKAAVDALMAFAGGL